MIDSMNDTAETIESDGAAVAEAVKQKAASIGERISKAGEAVREAMSEGYDSLNEKAHDLEAGVEKQIHQYPMSSVLIAVAVGVVVGYLIHTDTRR